MNRVDRLMGYMLLFQSRGLMRAQDFAAQFEISERTVYRDVQALSEVGVPIMAIPGEGYRLMEGYYLPPITFTPDEARALSLALSMMVSITKAGPTQAATESALEKIRAVLPAATQRQVEALEAVTRFYHFQTNTLDFDNKIFVELQEAIQQQRVIRISYHAQHNNTITERDVEPTELVSVNNAWMVNGYCRLRQDSRAFRLDRIDSLWVLDEQFSPRPLQRRNDWGPVAKVVVSFTASAVRWVRERQHYSLVEDHGPEFIPPDSDEDVIMVYQPRSLDQIEWWLLSWGDKMQVIEPRELRNRIAATAENLLNKHRR
ncbi:MAG: YafY family protein [Anaerolineae bacterium]|nr:YafY family protein [Anaerolineae bacterium]